MSLDIDKEKMTIMGIAFENRSVFKSVWYALSTNMIEPKSFIPLSTRCNLQNP